MSTKIFNSNRIWANDIEEVIKAITKTKPLAQNLLLDFGLDKIYEEAIKIQELNILFHACFEENVFEQSERSIDLEELNKTHGSFDIANNLIDKRETEQTKVIKEHSHEMVIYVFPNKLKENNKSYYIFSYNGPDELYKNYTSLIKKVEDYKYYNSSDRPEELTAKQWTKRKNDWKKVLPSGIIADDGIAIKVAKQRKSMFFFLNGEEEYAKLYFDEHIKKNPLEKRIARYVMSAATKIVFEDLVIEQQNAGTPVNGNSSSQFMMLYMKALRAVKEKKLSDEQIEKINVIENKIKETLFEITYENVTQPLLQQIQDAKTTLMQLKLEKEMAQKKQTSKLKL